MLFFSFFFNTLIFLRFINKLSSVNILNIKHKIEKNDAPIIQLKAIEKNCVKTLEKIL